MRYKGFAFVIVGLILASALIYLWDFYYRITAPLLTHVVGGFVIISATVFGLDRILAHRENSRWKQAKSGVLMEISSCLNGMLTNVRVIAGIDISVLGLRSAERMSSEDWGKHASQVITEYFEKRSNPLDLEISRSIRNQNPEAWGGFISGLQSCVLELDRLLSTFPAITSQPELIAGLIMVRKSVKGITSIRIMFPDILGVPIERQPTPKGHDKELVSNSIHDKAIQSIDDLIISVVAAKKTVDTMIWNQS